jgi:hypothetical protein
LIDIIPKIKHDPTYAKTRYDFEQNNRFQYGFAHHRYSPNDLRILDTFSLRKPLRAIRHKTKLRHGSVYFSALWWFIFYWLLHAHHGNFWQYRWQTLDGNQSAQRI